MVSPTSALAKLRWLKNFVAHPAVDAQVKDELLDQARDPAQRHLRWKPGQPLSQAHNAHYTNTPLELQQALQGEFNFFEGDIRLEGEARQMPFLDRVREPLMAHDIGDIDGLSFREWLQVGAASGRGIKLDIKQAAALPKVVEEVKRQQIPEHRLIFNFDAAFGPGVSKNLKVWAFNVLTDFIVDIQDLRALRREFPDATIALGLFTKASAPGTRYTDEQLDRLTELAGQVGGPITFPMRAEFLEAAAVRKLKPHGSVSVWNDPSSFRPDDLDQARRHFRAMGVDGMIDLRR